MMTNNAERESTYFISNDTVTRVRGKNYALYGACFFEIIKSKHGHESTLYLTAFDEIGAV